MPYRCLVPKKVDGLLLSGRCISCKRAPFQSARSMAPRNLDVKALQKLLVSQSAELRL